MAVQGLIGCDAPSGCDSADLLAWDEPLCQEDWKTVKSEIKWLYLCDVDENLDPTMAVTDWTDATILDAAVDNATTGNWKRVRGTGTIPAPSKEKIEGAGQREKTVGAGWEMTFTVDHMTQANYNFWAQNDRFNVTKRMAFATDDVIFADKDGAEGNKGIYCQIEATPVWDSGKNSILKIEAKITWDDLCWPVWKGTHPLTN